MNGQQEMIKTSALSGARMTSLVASLAMMIFSTLRMKFALPYEMGVIDGGGKIVGGSAVEDRHALSNKLITNALKRGDIQ